MALKGDQVSKPDDSTPTTCSGPYAIAALDYLTAGWSPLPLDGKVLLERGVTGRSGRYLTHADVKEFIDKWPTANIGLRLPRNVIGLDIDCYDGKQGRKTLTRLVGQYGPLPETWCSTSRTDGSSIRLFRVPPGFDGAEFRDPGDGIEVIQSHHRYVIVAPSLHPERQPYLWYQSTTRGLVLRPDEIPAPEELAVLPVSLASGLRARSGRERARRPVPHSPRAALAAFSDPEDEPCPKMRQTLKKWVGEPGSAYVAARAGTYALIGDAALGHRGAYAAVRRLGQAYMRATRDRSRDTAGEFNRQLIDELAKRQPETFRTDDPCDWSR